MDNRQKALYEYLLEKGDTYTPQAEIARDLFQYYGNGECFIEPKDYHNTTERLRILMDIREINANLDYEKLIISNSKGVKIATEEEFDKYIKNQYNATIRKLSRIYKMAKKGNRHKQIDFGGNTIEAFLNNFEKPIDND
jgi:CO dehydrogenase/acetyl-CoA synthase delta subunit